MRQQSGQRHRKWAFFAAGLSLILLGCFVRVMDPYPVKMSRLIYFDYLQRLAPRNYYPDLPVRVVDIDETSLAELGQWPWPRSIISQLVETLGHNGAAVIAFDTLFAEPDRFSPSRLLADPTLASALRADSEIANMDNDVQLGEAVSEWPVVLGVAARTMGEADSIQPRAGIIEIGDFPGAGLFTVPHWTSLAPPLGEKAWGIGGINVSPLGGTGVVRKVPVLWNGPNGILPALSLEALRIAMGETNIIAEGSQDEKGIMLSVNIGEFVIPTTEFGEIWVRYRKDYPDLYLSAADVLRSPDDPSVRDRIEGHIVLVGTSAAGLIDIRETALGEAVPGVSIHAQIIEQILQGEVLRRSDVTSALELISFAVLGLVVVFVMSRFGAVASFIAGGVAAAVVLVISWSAFQSNSVLFDATFPLMGGMANFGLLAGYLFISTEREKRAIRQTFSHYVAPEILDEMETNGHTLKLGGDTQDITVMFSDIRGFTALSETVSATELVTNLNELFSTLGDQILSERGTIDKFIGDAVMAFWNAPMPLENHPIRAAQAALRMREALNRINVTRLSKGQPRISLATGCATGIACVGNIGSRSRFNYTVIGDVVNVAARIEQTCRHVDYDILVSETVFQAIGQEMALLEAGVVPLKGKALPEPIFLVVGGQETARSAVFKDLAGQHEKLVDALRKGQLSDDTDRIIQRCSEIAEEIEPGLLRFYLALPGRVSDFASGVVPRPIMFRHFEPI